MKSRQHEIRRRDMSLLTVRSRKFAGDSSRLRRGIDLATCVLSEPYNGVEMNSVS